jgi:hypothetical protein
MDRKQGLAERVVVDTANWTIESSLARRDLDCQVQSR